MPTYPPNTILLDRYRIERLIGAGAFAEVYLATHLALHTHYALKILRKDAGLGSTLFADYVQRFRLEAQLGAALRHNPHIVPVYDFEEADDLLILRMDYAPGGSLQQRLDAVRRKVEPPLSIDETVRIARQVALGLAADEERRQGLDPRKRERLLSAGVDLIVTDFLCHDDLVRYLAAGSNVQ